MQWGILLCVLSRYSRILGRGAYRSAHDPPFEKGSFFSVLMLENHIKTQTSLRESIYERGVLGCFLFYLHHFQYNYLVRAAGSRPDYVIAKCKMHLNMHIPSISDATCLKYPASISMTIARVLVRLKGYQRAASFPLSGSKHSGISFDKRRVG